MRIIQLSKLNLSSIPTKGIVHIGMEHLHSKPIYVAEKIINMDENVNDYKINECDLLEFNHIYEKNSLSLIDNLSDYDIITIVYDETEK